MSLRLLVAVAAAALAAPAAGAAPALAAPPPALAAARQDSAESLYRAARAALSDGDYDRAAEGFRDVAARFPRAPRAADALYYEAFARYRAGGTRNLRAALAVLDTQRRRYADASTRDDAAALATRIRGELARAGDAEAAATVAGDARAAAAACPRGGDEDERVAALNALAQMEGGQAVPVLERVLARRDACSAPLRRKAVFLLSQQRGAETADALLRVAQNDPDREVREQAVFWLSQVRTPRATDVLVGILNGSGDPALREKALFALSQQDGERGRQVLRDLAARDGRRRAPAREGHLLDRPARHRRERALPARALRPAARRGAQGEGAVLAVADARAGERALAARRGAGRARALAVRKKAIFGAQQAGVGVEQLGALYGPRRRARAARAGDLRPQPGARPRRGRPPHGHRPARSGRRPAQEGDLLARPVARPARGAVPRLAPRPVSAPRPLPRRAASRRAAALATAVAAALLAPAAAAAQPDAGLAARVAAADGPVVVRFTARPDACGDGRALISLGERMTINGSSYISGDGWGRRTCLPGPARVTLVVRGAAVEEVRVRVGGAADARDAAARDLGAVSAPAAAAYFVALAGRTNGRAGEQAVVAAALADSASVWQPLLALARRHADDRVARSAMHWLGAVAPAEAVPAIARVLGDGAERRPVREGAATALAFAPDGAGVPPLAAAAAGVPAAGGGDAWTRDKAVFWLGNARDPRARAALRTLAAADTAPEPVRAQAIFALGHLDRDDDDGNAAFLRALYPRLASGRLRDRVVQSVAQSGDPASLRWLLDVAADAGQTLEARKQALFWAGQQSALGIDALVAADARLAGTELRRHYAFVLSQRHEEAAVDRLVVLARGDADPAVRRQAIFWLGQSRSPRARAYLESVVAR
jgi:HEAT repeat protein